jgi:hypothetical protein
MKFSAADWLFLRMPLLVFSAILLLGVGLIWFTQQQLDQSGHALKKQQEAYREANGRLHKSGDEKERILRYRPAFQALQRSGFVGEEQRINWVDALRAASLQLKMFGVSYQIEAQQGHPLPPGLDAGPYRLRQSVMKINMGVLHEEDLTRFMGALAESQAGFFTIGACDLRRENSSRGENVGVQPHLDVDCSLAWLTMNEGKGDARP